MAGILGSLRINHERAIGDLTLEADQGNLLKRGKEKKQYLPRVEENQMAVLELELN